MFVSDYEDCDEFMSGDDAILRELLHSDKAALELRYSLAHAIVQPGKSTFLHRLSTSEVYYILEGEGLMQIDDEERRVVPRQAVYIPPGALQRITNNGAVDLKFLCIVDPAWRVEDEEIL